MPARGGAPAPMGGFKGGRGNGGNNTFHRPGPGPVRGGFANGQAVNTYPMNGAGRGYGMPFTPDYYRGGPTFYAPPMSPPTGPYGMAPMMQQLPPAPFKTDYYPPLDPTRFYLLGQVEYYLSPECALLCPAPRAWLTRAQ